MNDPKYDYSPPVIYQVEDKELSSPTLSAVDMCMQLFDRLALTEGQRFAVCNMLSQLAHDQRINFPETPCKATGDDLADSGYHGIPEPEQPVESLREA